MYKARDPYVRVSATAIRGRLFVIGPPGT